MCDLFVSIDWTPREYKLKYVVYKYIKDVYRTNFSIDTPNNKKMLKV